MANSFHNYNPDKVILSWPLVPGLFSGYAEGTFIEAERIEPSFKMKGGADGETTRIQNRNRQGKITVTLKQGSATNALLSAILQADENLGNGVAPITLTDMSGTTPQTLCSAVNAWLEGFPKVGFGGQDEETRVWTFYTDTFEVFVGGN